MLDNNIMNTDSRIESNNQELPPLPAVPAFPIDPRYTTQNGGGNVIDYNAPSHLPSYPTLPAFPINPSYLKGGDYFSVSNDKYETIHSTSEFEEEQTGGNLPLPNLPAQPAFPVNKQFLPENMAQVYNRQLNSNIAGLPPMPQMPAYPIHPAYLASN